MNKGSNGIVFCRVIQKYELLNWNSGPFDEQGFIIHHAAYLQTKIIFIILLFSHACTFPFKYLEMDESRSFHILPFHEHHFLSMVYRTKCFNSQVDCKSL